MITVESSISVHEEGTKFYQVFRIFGKSGNSVAVTHWGSYHKGADITPANHGTHKIEWLNTPREATAKYNSMLSSKTKRGYKDWEGEAKNCTNEDVLKEALKGIFGREAVAILAHMKAVIMDDDDMGEVPEPAAPFVAPLSEPTTNERIERGELWAQW